MEYGLVLVWLLAYAGLAALALPATAALCRPFSDRGAGFALPVALATLGIVGYWVGHVRFGYPALLAGLVALATLSGVAWYRGVRPDPRGYGEAMAVFALAFGLFVAIRAFDPAVHPGGGEKFLDFGLLNSLLRTRQLPPEDVWFAGEPMPYYYGGHMVTALLTWLTDAVPLVDSAPRYAYNLALAGWYGAYVTTAYALAAGAAEYVGRRRRSAGALAAFLVGIASNLVTPTRLLAWMVPGFDALAGALVGSRGPISGGLADGPGSFEYWSAHIVIRGTNNEFPFFAFLNGDMHAHMMSPPFLLLLAGALLAYWRTPAGDLFRRRAIVFLVVPPLAGLIAVVNTWSLPTVAGLTFLGLTFAPADPRDLLPGAVSRGLDRVAAPAPGPRTDGGRPENGDPAADDSSAEDEDPPAAGGEPPATEDGPSTTEADPDGESNPGPEAIPEPGANPGTEATPDPNPGTTSEATPGERSTRTLAPATVLGREGVRVVTALAIAAFVVGVGALLVYPYLTMTAAGRGVGLVENRSSAWGLLLVHGAFLAITAVHVLPGVDPGEGHRGRALFLLGILLVVFGFAGVAAVFPFVTVLVAAWLVLRTDGDPDFAAAMAVGAIGLVVLVEFVRVTNAGPGRYNTVFKVYAQVWALWGTAAGVMVAGYVDPAGYLRSLRRYAGAAGNGENGEDSEGGGDGGESASPDPPRPTYAGVLAAVLVVGLSLYAGFALAGHLDSPTADGGPTLDALAFVEDDHPEEAEAIRWIRDLEGQPNVATAPTSCMYRWTSHAIDCGGRRKVVGASAPASLTGVPTLAGWYHEIGYRGEEEFLARVREVRTLFDGSPARQADVLRKHDVEFVYVGPAERDRYDGVAFDERLEGVEVAHESGEVVIYRVYPDRVAPDPDYEPEDEDGGGNGNGGGGSGGEGDPGGPDGPEPEGRVRPPGRPSP